MSTCELCNKDKIKIQNIELGKINKTINHYLEKIRKETLSPNFSATKLEAMAQGVGRLIVSRRKVEMELRKLNKII